jgi:outer membrane protein insertion porin family
VRRSIERIYNLGFIDAAEPNILPTGSPDIMDMVFNITEGKPGMITAGAGYSSVDYFVGSVQFQHMNLFGMGQKLNLLWEFGARRQNYEIDWTDPWIFNKNASLTLSAYNIERKRDYSDVTDAYKENRVGASVRVGPRISDYIGLLFGYTYEHVRLFDIDSSVRKDIESATDLSKDRTSSIMGQVVYDSRDYIFDPSRGNRHLFNIQLAGGPIGGNVNFVKGMAKSSWFFPIFWKFVLSVNVNAGFISSYGGQDSVPIYEKFYIGGADTVRGYKYRTEIGPTDGGTFMTVANIEYKFPIVAEKGRTILQGAFFYDIGGTWARMEDADFTLGTDENNLRSGVGFGIRFATPVFPLRLDWGYGLNHKEGESLQQFYFTIGNVF